MMQLEDYHLLGTFPQRSYKKGDGLCPHEKLAIKYCIARGIKTDKSKPEKLCISVAFTEVSKLGLHPDIFQA